MPYLTVEEMRENADLLKQDTNMEEGGSRFSGSTDTGAALQYLSKNGKILECGSSIGSFTRFLQEQGYRTIHALDFTDALLFGDKARITFHTMDFNTERMPYPDGFFDGITAWGIAEHLENPYHFMREAHRVLKDGAPFLVSVPSIFHWMSRLLFLKTGMFPRWNRRNNHIAVFPRGVFEKIVLRYFNLIEIRYTRQSFWLNQPSRLSRYLPKNEWFGNYVVYVLKKKAFMPYQRRHAAGEKGNA